MGWTIRLGVMRANVPDSFPVLLISGCWSNCWPTARSRRLRSSEARRRHGGRSSGKAAARDQGARLDDLDAMAWAIAGVPELAAELGKYIDALDVSQPYLRTDGAVAVGALAVPHRTTPPVS